MTVSRFINEVLFKVKKEDVQKVNNTIADIKNTASKVLGAIGVGISLTAINSLVEEFTLVTQQVRNSTAELGEQAEIQEKILAAATITRTAYSQTAGVVADLVHENAELFGTIDEAINFNNAATMLFKTAGKTNEEIAGLMEAINKSFAKGYVDSETLSQMLEKAPEAVELLKRQLGATSDQLEQLATDGKFTVADLKAAFVNNADAIAAAYGNVKMSVTDALTVIRNKWGLWLAETNEMLGITDSIAKTVVKASDTAMRAVTKVRTGVMWLGEKLGGVENLTKLVAIAAGAIWFAFNFDAITSGIAAVIKFLKAGGAQALAMVAEIILIALLIDDFVNFMKGNKSLMGSILEQAGVDCDALRETIVSAWNYIRDQLLIVWDHIHTAGVKVWQALKQAAQSIFEGLKVFWSKWGEDITETFGVVFDSCKVIFDSFLAVIIGLADFIGAVFSGDWAAAWQAILDIFTGIWDALIAFITAKMAVINQIYEIALDFITKLWKSVWNGIKSFLVGILNGLKTAISNAWNGIKTTTANIWNGIKSTISNIWNGIKTAVSNAINNVKTTIANIWNSIKSTTSTVWKGIKSTVSSVVDGVKSSVTNAFNSLKSSVTTIWNNIKSAITKPINDAWSAVKGVVDKLKSAFDFDWSLPKLKLPHITVTGGVAPYGIGGKGSLPKFDIQWYREGGILEGATIFGAMGGKLLGGGEAGKEAVIPLAELWAQMRTMIADGVTSLTRNLAPLADLSTIAPATAGSMISNSSTRTIIITNNFNQQFNGERAAQQKASTAMKAATTDISGELARALAFAK